MDKLEQPPLKNHPMKYVAYLSTGCGAASFAGLIGAYAMIKKSMSQELGFQQAFLGVLDGMSFLGNTLGFLFLLLRPIKAPKRDFLINSFISVIVLSLIPLSPLFISYCQPVLIMVHLISGFTRAYMMVPYMIVIQYFDAAIDNKISINFWCSFSVMGDVTAVLASSFLLNNLGINWKICLYVAIIAFILCVIFQHVTTQDVDMTKKAESSAQKTTESSLAETKQFLIRFYSKGENILWVIDYAFVSSLYFSILMWFPYYFLKLGYQNESSIISIMYPIFTCIGVLVYQYPILLCPSKAHVVIFTMLAINVSFYIIMSQMGNSKSDIMWYIILVAASGLVKGGPYPTITSSEMRLRARTNQDVYFAMTTGRISLMTLTILLMIIIGVLMQINTKSFLYVLSITTFINLMLNMGRNLYYGPPGKSKQTMVEQNKENNNNANAYEEIKQDQ